MAIIPQKPDMNLGIWAEDGNVESPTSDKISMGWSVEKPLNVQMNWVQNRQDSMLQYINQRGIPEWDQRTTYPQNAFVAQDGILYQAISQNEDRNPSNSSGIWRVSFATQQSVLSLNDEISKIKDEVGYLPYYVLINSPMMLSSCAGVAYLNETKISGFSFSGNSPSILNNGNTVAVFDPVEDISEPDNKVVTMEVLLQVLQQYKVGDLYLTTNPATPDITLGYGKWERYAEGRTLVGVSTKSEDPDWTKGVGGIVGAYTHTLTEREMPKHSHKYLQTNAGGGISVSGGASNSLGFIDTTESGGGEAHSIVQPSMTTFIWRRTA